MPWSWIVVVMKIREDTLIEQVGMDATIFLRFVRMCRNLFLILAVLGVGVLVPVHYQTSKSTKLDWVLQITPLNIDSEAIWAQVVMAWVFDIIIVAFLWWNYRKVLGLRRKYFETEDYQNSLHSRTLMVSLHHSVGPY